MMGASQRHETYLHEEMTCATSKWWENHLPNIDLMQEGDTLRWYLMWGQDPPPYAQLSICLYVLLLPYLDDIVVLCMGLHGQEVGSVFVPQSLELTPMLNDTFFRCGTTPNIFISVEFFSPGGDGPCTCYINLGGTIHGGLAD